ASVTYKGNKAVVDTWVLSAALLKSIYNSYDTDQIFMPDDLVLDSGKVIDMRSSFSYVPTKTLNLWYLKEKVKKDYLISSILIIKETN
ncbi:hypothetical protein, partial [Photobacterium damselae]|uniref:hypothetical protein n=1 Tax=Photobacterium damselae TaxID=38293 RepID=UPI003B97DE86